jgi:hypothetical protein
MLCVSHGEGRQTNVPFDHDRIVYVFQVDLD